MLTLAKKLVVPTLALLLSSAAFADKPGGTYQFDKKGAHQFVMFKISHLGYSWLYGRFNDFDGTFTVDEDNPENSSVEATIQTASLDSNHAERDKHLRGDDSWTWTNTPPPPSRAPALNAPAKRPPRSPATLPCTA